MKKLTLPLTIIGLLLIITAPVFAGGEFTGAIRISPALPLMVESPATFEIWLVPPPAPPGNDPHVLLVMTEASYSGLSGDVVVSWTGGSTNFPKTAFLPVNTGYVPTSGTTEGGRYTVASLQDHLGVSHSEMVYYAHGPFLAEPITQTHQTFTVNLPSTNPRMLVYAIAKCDGSTLFNQKVPTTIPGFVVPELGPALLAIASFGALALYTVKRRKT